MGAIRRKRFTGETFLKWEEELKNFSNSEQN
jgi:hypothetical protein